MVGASPNRDRPSYQVMEYLQDKGYRVLPINPLVAVKGGIILGEVTYPSLLMIPEELKTRIDIVDIFRKPEDVDSIVTEAITIGAKTVWMQLGVVNEMAAEKATAAGMNVIMDRCPKIEYERVCQIS